MPINTMSQVVAALPGQIHHAHKVYTVARAGGTWQSLWRITTLPPAGAIPPTGNGEIPTRTTTGAIPFTAPASGNTLYLGRLSVSAGTRALLILYDRLWHNSGFDANITTVQTIPTPPTLTRPDSTGHDVELWGEVYADTGTTASTFTVSYTNSEGVSGRSATYTKPAAAQVAGEMFPFSLESGDTGVRTVSSVQLSAATGTAGNFGLVLLRRIVEIPLSLIDTLVDRDAIALGMPRIEPSACLAFAIQATISSFSRFLATVYLIEG